MDALAGAWLDKHQTEKFFLFLRYYNPPYRETDKRQGKQ